MKEGTRKGTIKQGRNYERGSYGEREKCTDAALYERKIDGKMVGKKIGKIEEIKEE